MLKTIDIVFVCMVLAAVSATYVVKYGSEIKHSGIAKLEREIDKEKEAIDILNANWALLSKPSRMQALSERYKDELQLEDLAPEQIIQLEELPLRPIQLPKNRNAMNSQSQSDPVVTGGINKQEAGQ